MPDSEPTSGDDDCNEEHFRTVHLVELFPILEGEEEKEQWEAGCRALDHAR